MQHPVHLSRVRPPRYACSGGDCKCWAQKDNRYLSERGQLANKSLYNTWSKPKTANCLTISEELCGVIQSDALVHNLYGEVRHSQLRCYPLPDRHDLLQLGLGCRTLNGPVAALPEPPRVCGQKLRSLFGTLK